MAREVEQVGADVAESEEGWPASFDRVFTDRAGSVREQVWREVYGAEYPEGVDPFSYVTASELTQFVAESGLSPGELLLDIGCGGGGAGLHVAARTGARLIGLDISGVAVEEAQSRAATLGMAAGRSSFRLGEFQRTGLAGASVQAVMSVDALTFAEDKAAALEEIARVLAPGGRLVFTSWDYRTTPPRRPAQVSDHRPLLRLSRSSWNLRWRSPT